MAIKIKLETKVNGEHAGLHFVDGIHTAEGKEAEAKAISIAKLLGYEIIEDEKIDEGKKEEATKKTASNRKKKNEDK